MRNLAIIPARSGSKGLKDKNIRPLNNIPLMAYSIQAALLSKMFAVVMVSTDSERYAEIGKRYGAEVPFLRSSFTSSDTASSWDAVKEVVSNYKKMGMDFDTISLLQPTSPLRTSEDIQKAFDLFEEKKASSVISVCEVEHSPLWCSTLQEDLSMINFAQNSRPNSNRQMLETYYRLNGAIYLLRTEILDNVESLYKKNCFAYVMDRKHSIDIDCQDDFRYTEFLIKEGGLS